MAADPSEAKEAPAEQAGAASDRLYEYDEAAVDAMRAERPWDKDPKYFKKTKISALATMKMLQHALAGVDKGRRRGTNPVEVMGLCIGKPEGDTIVVTDTFPLPVEGTETKVVADDAQVYMTSLMDSMELRRKDRFVGWYHSHPFDVETYSHCHLSATDVQTQSTWQFPIPYWAAIVVDPLRSLAKQEPEFGCFRCYPPAYSPPANECPDGTVVHDETRRRQRWGVTHGRYYQLETSYFTSSLSGHIINVMSRNSLWIRVLSSSAVMEPENRERLADRVQNATRKLRAAGQQLDRGSAYALAGTGMGPGAEELASASTACVELALEQVQGHMSQLSKDLLFNSSGLDGGDAPAADAPAASPAADAEMKQA